MEYLYCSLIGYFIGTFNPSYFLAKKRGFDIRTKGSGNAGASNAVILFGKLRGFLCAALDIAKAYFAVYLTKNLLFADFNHAFAVTGTACVVGHIAPFYMKFKGGKGLACLGGIILYYDYHVFLIMLAVEMVIALITDYICFVPITASFAFPVIYGIMNADIVGALILGILPLLILYRHIENLKRIKQGLEMRLSFLWRPEREMGRLRENITEDETTIENHFSGGKKKRKK